MNRLPRTCSACTARATAAAKQNGALARRRAVSAGGASLRRARDHSAWPRASFEWCRE
ncbi:hypothetical protein BURMUCGD2M_0436 [Burkholderia multivorans CGD2M]|uniref:Uncharacterized protein n=1 Tax=Burkholderia multivorans CGD2 TaxID=513052 RepID=B9BZA9_9BURK|nr:hypothetical protein BURMUCGD2_3339 [Burkholderia multivorans CGD2]EEE12339.1 hypothetical protein BURMUCGD2M_0436 [Burkholderia multivorans CGD2M]